MSVINRGQADSGQVTGNANPGGDNGMEYVDDIHRGTRRKVRGTSKANPLSLCLRKTFFGVLKVLVMKFLLNLPHLRLQVKRDNSNKGLM